MKGAAFDKRLEYEESKTAWRCGGRQAEGGAGESPINGRYKLFYLLSGEGVGVRIVGAQGIIAIIALGISSNLRTSRTPSKRHGTA